MALRQNGQQVGQVGISISISIQRRRWLGLVVQCVVLNFATVKGVPGWAEPSAMCVMEVVDLAGSAMRAPGHNQRGHQGPALALSESTLHGVALVFFQARDQPARSGKHITAPSHARKL